MGEAEVVCSVVSVVEVYAVAGCQRVAAPAARGQSPLDLVEERGSCPLVGAAVFSVRHACIQPFSIRTNTVLYLNCEFRMQNAIRHIQAQADDLETRSPMNHTRAIQPGKAAMIPAGSYGMTAPKVFVENDTDVAVIVTVTAAPENPGAYSCAAQPGKEEDQANKETAGARPPR